MTLYLLENFSRVNWADIGGRTALFFAVKNNNLAIVKMLLMYRANPGIISIQKESPLSLCEKAKNMKMYQFLKRARVLAITLAIVHSVELRDRIWRR